MRAGRAFVSKVCGGLESTLIRLPVKHTWREISISLRPRLPVSSRLPVSGSDLSPAQSPYHSQDAAHPSKAAMPPHSPAHSDSLQNPRQTNSRHLSPTFRSAHTHLDPGSSSA